MADKRIQDLTPASSVQTSDRFVLEQSGQAKSLTGQILINDLAAFLDGHGGINSISYTPPETGELDGTLTITLADETVETFAVTNGRGIANIGYVESIGLDDYYQIDYNDDSEPTTFVVHNGAKGDTGDDWYVHIKWAAVMPTQDSDMVNYPDDFIGIYSGTSSTAPTSYGEYDWYEYKGEKGDTGTGITGVALESSSGLVDTYRVSFDDGTSTTFNVTNGSQINSITKTSSFGLTDTYTVTLTNGTQTTFQVTNGKSIVSITWTNTTSPTGVPHVPGATDTYTITYNDGDSTTFQIYNGLDGEGASITVDGIPSVNGNVPLLVIDTEHGAPTPQTVGSLKSRYFDALNSVLYICLGYDENNGYLWRGAGVTVDSALSTSSTNPVQNRVITNKIGTAALDTTAQDLSGAVNEILDDISGFADNLADEYDATATYAVGDLRIHDNVLYRCNTAISTPEAWNSIHWTATSVDEQLDGKVSKSGDSMTGSLAISGGRITTKSTDIDTNTTPSAITWGTGQIRFEDKDNDPIALFIPAKNTANQQGLVLGARRSVSGSLVDNLLNIYIDGSGNRIITVSDAAIWRSALNAVNKAGDTMTGHLELKSSNFQDNVPPSATTWGSELQYRDKLGALLGSLHIVARANGDQGLGFTAMRRLNGEDKNNAIELLMTSNGTRKVNVSDSSVWRSTLGLGTNGAFPITIAQGGSGQTELTYVDTKASIITPASGITIGQANYAQWGKVAQLYIVWSSSSTITVNPDGNATNVVIGTIASGKRPKMTTAGTSYGDSGGPAFYLLETGGTVQLGGCGGTGSQRTIAANTTFQCSIIYLLP